MPYEAVNIERYRKMLLAETDEKRIAELKFLLDREEQTLLESMKLALSSAKDRLQD